MTQIRPYPEVRRSLTDVVYVVAQHFGLSPSDVLGNGRSKLVGMTRSIAYALCRDVTRASSTEIASLFGRDHTTVLTMVERLASRMKADQDLARSVAVCRAQAVATIAARKGIP